MRKKGIILFAILGMFLMPNTVKAFNGSVTVSCTPASLTGSGIVTCTLKGNVDTAITGVKGTVSLPTGATITNFTLDDKNGGWQQADYANNQINPYRENEVTGQFDIGTLTINFSGSVTEGNKSIQLINITYSDDNALYTAPDSNTATVNVISKIGLSSLEAGTGVLAPTFTTSNTAYLLTLSSNVTTFGFDFRPFNTSDTVKITNSAGTVLSPGSITYTPDSGQDHMMVYLDVGEGDRHVKYTITVRKEAASGTGTPTIRSLTVGGKYIDVDDDEITATVSTNSYQVVATLSDSANYVFETANLPSSCNTVTGTLTCNLTGSNSMPIIITSKSDGGGSKTYILKINVSSGTPSSTPTTPSDPSGNPNTGNPAGVIMAVVLILSFGASLYFYKQNIQNFNS